MSATETVDGAGGIAGSGAAETPPARAAEPRAPRQGRPMTAARGIRLMLGVQIALGAVLLMGDALPGLLRATSPAPALDQPVVPGDQTRRYQTPRRPGLPFQAPGADRMPTRLQWEVSGSRMTLEGGIAPGDASRLAEALEAMDPAPELVALNSPGGSVFDALEIGRRLRAIGADTAVGDGGICLSACPYMLAGGVERAVDPGARVGVHQHYYGENTFLPVFMAVEDIQRGQGEVMAFLEEMEIDLRLMRPSLLTPPQEIYILMPEELTDYRLATRIGGVTAEGAAEGAREGEGTREGTGG